MKYKKYELLNFNSTYKAKGYPKKVWAILNEYFSRYKHEFDLSDSEIKNKLDILLNNLDKISISKKNISSYMGIYCSQDKHIEINSKYMDSLGMGYENILNTIFHELFHALENSNSELCTSFQERNNILNRFTGTALNEILTEMKASRLAKNDRNRLLKRKEKDKNVLKLDGYEDLIFIGTMMHTTLGISEIDFLKHADMGKGSFDDQICTKFPNKDYYNNFMEEITFYSDALHTIKYNRNTKEPYTQEDLSNMEDCISSIYNSCLYAMLKTIPYHVLQNIDTIDMKDYMLKCKFNIERLKSNYKYGMGNIIEKDDIDLEKNPILADLQEKLLAIETLYSNKDKITDYQLYETLSDITNSDYLSGRQHLLIHDLIPSEDDITSINKPIDSKYKRQLLKEDYGELSWNNNKCNKHIKSFLKMDSFLYKAANKINELIKSKNQELLPSASSVYSVTPDDHSNGLSSLKELVNTSSEYESEIKDITGKNIDIDMDNIK